MDGLTVLMVTGIVFIVGLIVGIRGQEINLRNRERRLAEQRRRVNAQLRSLDAYRETNILLRHAQDELRQAALLHGLDVPVFVDLTIDLPSEAAPSRTPRTVVGAQV